MAATGVRWIQALQPEDVPRLGAISVDAGVLLFTVVLSVASGILFGLAPAAGLGRIDLHGTLKEAGRGSSGGHTVWGRGNSLRRLLVVAELALSVVLLIGAGLLIRSVAHLQNVPPGFTPANVLTLELTMTGRKYADGPAVQNAYKSLWERLDALPGVTASGGVTSLPLSGYFAWGPITVEGRTPPPGENFINADIRVASGRYFEAMDIPLRAGRRFTADDTPDKPRVVLVDEFMAAELWPGQDAVGKRIRFGDLKSTSPWLTVIGVVGRVKQYGLDTDGRIALYLPHTQSGSRAMYVVVKGRTSAEALASPVRAQIRDLDADLPIYRLKTMDERVEASLARRRFSMTLLSLFATIALVLATIGIYSVISYLVSQGARELGIRIALGATPPSILKLVLSKGLALALAGVGVGLFAAFALTRVMRSLLYGVQGTDGATFTAVALLLATIALVASYVPARRAARIDPIASLRTE